VIYIGLYHYSTTHEKPTLGGWATRAMIIEWVLVNEGDNVIWGRLMRNLGMRRTNNVIHRQDHRPLDSGDPALLLLCYEEILYIM
jgi:hypothetical protein